GNHRFDLLAGQFVLFDQLAALFAPGPFVAQQQPVLRLQVLVMLEQLVEFRCQALQFGGVHEGSGWQRGSDYREENAQGSNAVRNGGAGLSCRSGAARIRSLLFRIRVVMSSSSPYAAFAALLA